MVKQNYKLYSFCVIYLGLSGWEWMSSLCQQDPMPFSECCKHHCSCENIYTQAHTYTQVLKYLFKNCLQLIQPSVFTVPHQGPLWSASPVKSKTSFPGIYIFSLFLKHTWTLNHFPFNTPIYSVDLLNVTPFQNISCYGHFKIWISLQTCSDSIYNAFLNLVKWGLPS